MSLILYRLLARWLNLRRNGLLNLKDLLARFRRVPDRFFRSCGTTETCCDRSIDSTRVVGEFWKDLLNLKDLLTVSRASRKGSVGSEPVLRRLFSCRIAPNFAVFEQKRADNRRKWGFLGTGFWSARQVLRGRVRL